MDDLADAYLVWKHLTNEPTTTELDIVPKYDFIIHVVDIYMLHTDATIHFTESSKFVAVALVLQGYLGTTPEQPSIAMSLQTLKLYYRIRRVGLPGDWQVGDLRTFEDSDYYTSNDFMNRFADKVKKPQPAPSSKPLYLEAEETTLESMPDDA
ncbi:hypothetical protein C0993_006607 [Termitomyces sp. T159_Od127]|nr:hypothetical protein C0993_006607 [Termitomyces sp. T159_Od127]